MAEFTEVMKHLKRMCESYRFCDDGCQLYDGADGLHTRCAAMNDTQKEIFMPGDIVERAVMNWAKEHPEPKLIYPTWKEWFTKTYPNGRLISFCPRIVCGTFACVVRATCEDCVKQPIPEHIAKELGIEPRRENE